MDTRYGTQGLAGMALMISFAYICVEITLNIVVNLLQGSRQIIFGRRGY